MFTILLFLFSYNVCCSPADLAVENKISSATENISQPGSANKAAIAYGDIQTIHLQQLEDLIDGFLSSGHTTGSRVMK
jgi:hypothetical protein